MAKSKKKPPKTVAGSLDIEGLQKVHTWLHKPTKRVFTASIMEVMARCVGSVDKYTNFVVVTEDNYNSIRALYGKK